MKKLLSYGDSIAFGYKDALKEYVSHKYTFFTKEGMREAAQNLNIPKGTNCGDSRMMLRHIREEVEQGLFQFDVIVFNCGKHDIKVDLKTGHRQISPEEYQKNMREITALIKAHSKKAFYVNCTKVYDDIHNTPENIELNFGIARYDKDMRLCNEQAEEIMKEAGIPVIDLYDLSEKWGEKALKDHVHYHPAYAELQAAYIAGAVLTMDE